MFGKMCFKAKIVHSMRKGWCCSANFEMSKTSKVQRELNDIDRKMNKMIDNVDGKWVAVLFSKINKYHDDFETKQTRQKTNLRVHHSKEWYSKQNHMFNTFLQQVEGIDDFSMQWSCYFIWWRRKIWMLIKIFLFRCRNMRMMYILSQQ